MRFILNMSILISKGFIVVMLLLAVNPANAQHNWSINVADYENSGDVTGIVLVNGIEVTEGALGAFVGDECRGFSDEPTLFPLSGYTTFQFLIYSNEGSGETISLKYYNPADGLVYNVTESVDFVSNMILGSAYEPLEFNVAINRAPEVENQIADETVDEYFESFTIDLSGAFSDPDSDILSYTAESSNPDIVTVSVSGSVLTVTEVGNGSCTITVTASDGNESVSDVFSITVTDINVAPVVSEAIEDRKFNLGFIAGIIDISNVFTDADGDVLSYSAVSSNVGVVTVELSGTTLTINEVAGGSSTITVTASDGLLSVDDVFILVVNTSPVVLNPISDISLNEGFATYVVDISTLFSDSESDPLTISAVSSAEEVVTVSLSGTTLTISEVSHGSAEITITASDGGLAVADLFAVDVNGSPLISSAIDDLTLDEGFETSIVELAGVFSDPEDDALILNAVSSDTNVATAAIAGTTLTITEVGTGSTTITVSASDGALSIADVFIVLVNEVNNAPVVVNAIEDQSVNEEFVSMNIDLSTVFEDSDEDELTYTAESDNEEVVTVSVSGSMLTITESGLGSATITATASDGLLSAETLFLFTVSGVNSAPVIINPIDDQTIIENIDIIEIDLTTVFSDSNSDTLSFSISFSDNSILSYTLENAVLTLSPLAFGTVDVVVTAADSEPLTATDTFQVTVQKEHLLIIQYGAERIQNRDTIHLCNDAGYINLEVKTKNLWDFIKGSAIWLLVDVEDDSTLHIAFSENLTGADRNTLITVFDVQGHELDFYINQTEDCIPDGVATNLFQGLKVYPNPATDILFIEADGSKWENLTLEMIDINGKLLFSRNLPSNHNGPIEVDVRSFAKGYYIIRLFNGVEQFVGKVVL